VCRGGQLDGPNLGRLFSKLDSLQAFVPQKFHGYIECLRLLDVVKKSCFGSEKLWDDFEDRIREFEVSYRGLGISVTPKAHTIFYEVPIYCNATKKPLGIISTQPFESAHFDFEPTFNCYKRKESHPDHGKQVVKCMSKYNGEHI
jgi:hypothetical protein